MNGLPADWLGLLVVVYLFGMRHGLDPDHLATIDGLTRASQAARPQLARWSGVLFSAGHGLIVVVVCMLVGFAAGDWQTPRWLESTGTWISVMFLLTLGAFNVFSVFKTAPSAVVRPAGLLSRWVIRPGMTRHPLLIVATGALFALSFDTVSQIALFALAAKSVAGVYFCGMLGVVFMLGMMTSDGINGVCIARLLQRADRHAQIGSRTMGLAIGGTSLLVGCCVLARETLPPFAEFSAGRELEGGLLIIAIVLGSYGLAQRLAAVEGMESRP